MLVFFVSAVFHELLVGLPLHMVKAWSFIGIMSQARCLLFVWVLLHCLQSVDTSWENRIIRAMRIWSSLSHVQVPLMYITEFIHKRLKNEYAGARLLVVCVHSCGGADHASLIKRCPVSPQAI